MLLKDAVISVYGYKYKIGSPWNVEGMYINLICLDDNAEPTDEKFKMPIFEFLEHGEVEI